MTVFDYAVLGILFVSILLSVFRGLTREILSLAGWVIAFVVANSFSVKVAPMLPAGIGESLRMPAAFIVVFLATLVVAGLIAMLVSALIKNSALGFADRFLGLLFGIARGLLVVLLMVMLAGLTALPKEPFWRQAMLSRPLEKAVMLALPWLPPDLSRRIHYGTEAGGTATRAADARSGRQVSKEFLYTFVTPG